MYQKVINFKTHGADLVLYTAQDTQIAGQTVVRLWDGSASYDLRTFTPGTEVTLDISQHEESIFDNVSVDDEVYEKV
mgnify:CR=1 FL=1